MRKPLALLALLFVAVAVSSQTTGDDLSTALVNHGMDPASAAVAAPALELAIANSNALLARLAADEANIVTLQKQVAALTPLPPSGKQTVTIPASIFSSCSTTPAQKAITDPGGNGSGIVLIAGLRCNYSVPVTAGNYIAAIRFISANGNGANLHLEYPAGTKILIENVSSGNVWTTAAGPVFAAPAGNITVTLVADWAPPDGSAVVNFLQFVPQ